MTAAELLKFTGYMCEAAGTTLKVFFLTLLFGLPLGMVACLGRMSKIWVVRTITKVYLLIMRGTPLLLQLMFFKYAPYYIFGATMETFTAGIVAFAVNYAAYFAEIYRSGMEGIPKGQQEAAMVLGFSRSQTFFKITLPQVIKRILPPMGSEFMTLVKDTSLIQIIGVAEMYKLATQTMSREVTVAPLVVAGVFYLVMNAVVEKAFSMTEKKLSYYQ